MPKPQTHYFEVQMEWEHKGKGDIQFAMPVWAPGSYLVREFERHVEGINATVDGKSAECTKVKKNVWHIRSNGKKVTLSYRVYAFELSVRSSFLDSRHAYINGTSVLMYVKNRINEPHIISINPHPDFKTISVSLPRNGNTFTAESYDHLADSPMEIGNHKTFSFMASGVNHTFAMYGDVTYDEEKIKKDVTAIVKEAVAVFGEHPCKEYLFIVHHVPNGGGGLEHLYSTTLQTDRDTYKSENSYKGFLGLVAHEYFHLWNVKRLRPIELGPFNYDEENYTHNLWLAEGVTSYYDNLLLRRAGIMTEAAFVNNTIGDCNAIANLPADRIQSVADASFDAWIKYYRPHENGQNSILSYYTKGNLLGFLIDVELLHLSKGKYSLDNLMRNLYEKYYKKLGRGYTDQEVLAELVLLGGPSMEKFYNDYILGNKPIDYPHFFDIMGLELIDQNKKLNEAYLGAAISWKGGKQVVTTVKKESCAWEYGLNVNDEIIALDGYRVDDLPTRITQHYKPGDKIRISLMREDRLIELNIVLGKNEFVRYSSIKKEKPSEDERLVYNRWLKL
jgi:predicted metalloprotease with PDZ domain